MGQRQEILADTKDLESEIKKYESLIDVLNKQVSEWERSVAGKKRVGDKKGYKIPTSGTAEIQRSANEREKSLKALDSIDDKWQKKLTRVAHEAQKLVSPSETEAEQRVEIERLLKEIESSNQRQVNLNLKLDTLKA